MAATPAELAARPDVVILVVTGAAQVEADNGARFVPEMIDLIR